MRRPGPTVRTRVAEHRDGDRIEREDRLITEEPLEIRVRVEHLERVLSDIQNSPSWKITKPLRKLKGLGR